MPRKIDTAFVEIVPDFSGFEREADREISAAFRDVERTADRTALNIEDAFRDLERDIADVFRDIARTGEIDLEALSSVAQRTATEFGQDFQRGGEVAENAYSELRRTADIELARMDRSAAVATAAAGRRFNALGLVGSAALFGIGTAAVAGLGAVATMGLSSAASLEQTQISFNALLGSAEEGERVFRQLQKFAAVTPFEFPEVAAAAKRFLAFNDQVGIADSELQGFLTTIGDLASVTGAGAEGMNRIVLAIGQIAGKGRVQLEELMQIGEAVPGFSAVAAIANELGITTAEAMAKISAGELDATTGINALLAGMQKFPGAAGAMEKQSQTLLGVFSTFKDTVGQALADSFAPAIPAIKDTLTQITPILNDALRQLAPALGQTLVGLLAVVGPLVQAITPILTPILNALGPALAELGPELVPLGDALGELAVALVPLIPLIAELAIVLIQLLIPFVKQAAGTLQVLTPVINFLTDAVAEFGKFMNQINWNELGHDIEDGFTGAWEAVQNFFVGIGRFIASVPDKIIGFIRSLPERFVNVFKTMVNQTLMGLGIWIGLIIAAIKVLPGLIVSSIKALPGLIHDFFANFWDDAKETTTNRVNSIIEFVRQLPGKIMDAVISLPGLLVNFFITTFERAKSIVFGAVDAIVEFVRSIPSRIGSFAADVGTSIFNFFKRALNSAIGSINSGIAAVDDKLPGVTLPRIPMLAHGGIAMGPAIIGEDSRTGPEAALPLGDPRAMAMLRDALGTGTTFEPGAIIINVNVTGDMSATQAKRVGENLGEGVESVLRTRGITTAVRTA